MKFPQPQFRVPKSALLEPMPAKAFRLLIFLLAESDYAGTCRPGYAAMRAAIRDTNGERGCDSTVRRFLVLLQKRGWIFTMRRTRGKLAIWLQIPLRFRGEREPGQELLVLSPR